MKKLIILLVIVFSSTSCEKVLFKPNVKISSESIFEEYTEVMKEKYALFDVKDIDWDQKYNDFKPLITSSTTSSQLFDILGSMSLSLKDGHVVLRNPENNDNYSYDGYVTSFPSNFNPQIIWTYLWNPHYIGFPNDLFFWWNNFDFSAIQYNTLPNDPTIGYIQIPSFDVEVQDYELNNMISSFSETKGIIIDVRDNTGGDPKVAVKIASYFTDSPVYTGYERFKTGPSENDFSEDLELILQPSSGKHYTKPVIILTNRACFSATTLFIHQMDALPHVTFMGDRSGGGGGAVSDGILANGWKYALSVSQLYNADGVNVENGRKPDIKVSLVAEDEAAFIDTIIERAIEELK